MFGFLPPVNMIPREKAGVSPVVGVIPGEEWEILKQYIMSNCTNLSGLSSAVQMLACLSAEGTLNRFNFQLCLLMTV